MSPLLALLLTVAADPAPPVPQDPGYTYAWLAAPDRSRTLADEIRAPAGFVRVPVARGSFGDWLRFLPLRPAGTPVRLYTGEDKPRQDVHAAVVDLDVGKRDLQQCADAGIRLWAEYLWGTKQTDRLTFRLTNGMEVPWRRWAKGWRVKVEGNKTKWVKKRRRSASRKVFEGYVRFIMTYAGTASLARDLPRRGDAPVQPGDLLVQGGFPGHAVLVLDVAVSPAGERVALLGQSFMPAQDFHVLKSPVGADVSVWYRLADLDGGLDTPEWPGFTRDHVRRLEPGAGGGR